MDSDRKGNAPETIEIVDQLDDLVVQFKTTLEKLRKKFQENPEEVTRVIRQRRSKNAGS